MICPAICSFANARIVNVFTSAIEHGDILFAQRQIAGIGRDYKAREVVDLREAFAFPGFISGHCHPESSFLWLWQYASLVVSHGTTTVITDLHELVNVAGLTSPLSSRRQPADESATRIWSGRRGSNPWPSAWEEPWSGPIDKASDSKSGVKPGQEKGEIGSRPTAATAPARRARLARQRAFDYPWIHSSLGGEQESSSV